MFAKYNRSMEELESNACKWWPENLIALEAASSIIPTLVRTQDQFISILTLSNANNPRSIFDVIIVQTLAFHKTECAYIS